MIILSLCSKGIWKPCPTGWTKKGFSLLYWHFQSSSTNILYWSAVNNSIRRMLTSHRMDGFSLSVPWERDTMKIYTRKRREAPVQSCRWYPLTRSHTTNKYFEYIRAILRRNMGNSLEVNMKLLLITSTSNIWDGGGVNWFRTSVILIKILWSWNYVERH